MFFSIVLFSLTSIILLMAVVANPTACCCHKAFSSSSRGSRNAFICATQTSKSLQSNVETVLAARHNKQTDDELVCEVIESSSNEGRGVLGRRRWIRDMIVFGSNSIAARTYASTTTASSSDIYSASSSTSAGGTLSKAAAICDPTIESYQKGSNKIHIIGTAHVSSVSAQLAGSAVKEIKPTAVFIELDPQRIDRAFRNGRITQSCNIVYFSESKGGQVTMRTATLFPQDFEKKKSKGLFKVFEKLRVQNPIQEMYEGFEAQGITPGEEVSLSNCLHTICEIM
jgi:hypothetical protein